MPRTLPDVRPGHLLNAISPACSTTQVFTKCHQPYATYDQSVDARLYQFSLGPLRWDISQIPPPPSNIFSLSIEIIIVCQSLILTVSAKTDHLRFVQYGPKSLQLKPTKDSVISTLQCSMVSYLALMQVPLLCEAFLSHSNAPAKSTNGPSTVRESSGQKHLRST